MKNKFAIIIGIISFVAFILMLTIIPNPTWWQVDIILVLVIATLLSVMSLTKKKKPPKEAAKYINKALSLLNKMQHTNKSKRALYLLIIKNDITFAVDRLEATLKHYEKYDLKFTIDCLNKIIQRYNAMSNNSEKLIESVAADIYKTDATTLEQVLIDIESIFDAKK